MGSGRVGPGRAGPGREYSDFSLKYERTRSARCARSLVINGRLEGLIKEVICALLCLVTFDIQWHSLQVSFFLTDTTYGLSVKSTKPISSGKDSIVQTVYVIQS